MCFSIAINTLNMKTQCKTVFKSIFYTPFFFNTSFQTRQLALPKQFLKEFSEYKSKVTSFFALKSNYLIASAMTAHADYRYTIRNIAGEGELLENFKVFLRIQPYSQIV